MGIEVQTSIEYVNIFDVTFTFYFKVSCKKLAIVYCGGY